MKKTLILSSVILGFLAFMISPLAAQDEPAPPPRPGLESRIQKWLDLTAEQQAKLQDLRKARQEENKGLFEQLKKMRRDLQQAMQDPKSDQKKVEALIDDMHRLQATRMKAQFKFRKDMEKILTPDQLEKLKKVKSRMGDMRRAGRFLRRHPRLRGMMGPGGFGFRGARQPWGRGFRQSMRWDW